MQKRICSAKMKLMMVLGALLLIGVLLYSVRMASEDKEMARGMLVDGCSCGKEDCM